jgi:hypothetical protein
MGNNIVNEAAQKHQIKSSVSADEWRAHYLAWKRSLLSKSDFCVKHGLKKDNFYYWCKRLRDKKSPMQSAAFAPVMSRVTEIAAPELITVEIFLLNQTRLKFSVKETRLISLIQEVCDAATIIR